MPGRRSVNDIGLQAIGAMNDRLRSRQLYFKCPFAVLAIQI